MTIFERMEATPLSDWLSESLYAYPTMLAFHSIGMSIVIGIFIILNLRLLGMFSDFNLSRFRPLIKLAWFGFLVNFLTGCILFVQKASIFIETWSFLIKIAGVFVAITLAVFIQKLVRKVSEYEGAYNEITLSAKSLAVASLILWSIVIIAGRIVGYMLQ